MNPGPAISALPDRLILKSIESIRRAAEITWLLPQWFGGAPWRGSAQSPTRDHVDAPAEGAMSAGAPSVTRGARTSARSASAPALTRPCSSLATPAFRLGRLGRGRLGVAAGSRRASAGVSLWVSALLSAWSRPWRLLRVAGRLRPMHQHRPTPPAGSVRDVVLP